jgi:hypothetical protein
VSKYIAEVPYRLQGIPCLIGVIDFESVQGSYSRNAPSDLDYYGYTDCTWDVLDQRGRPAPWLERKLTDRDRDDIDQTICEHMEQPA